MREIVLDTETTGLDPLNGDRIVEIGAVKLVNRTPTGRVPARKRLRYLGEEGESGALRPIPPVGGPGCIMVNDKAARTAIWRPTG